MRMMKTLLIWMSGIFRSHIILSRIWWFGRRKEHWTRNTRSSWGQRKGQRRRQRQELGRMNERVETEKWYLRTVWMKLRLQRRENRCLVAKLRNLFQSHPILSLESRFIGTVCICIWFLCDSLYSYGFKQILLLAFCALNSRLLVLVVLLFSLSTVIATPDMQPFRDITFKIFSDFVSQNFSSQVSLATVLLVLFSLTENPDLLNLHGHQQNPYIQGERKETSSGWIKILARALEDQLGSDARTLVKHKEIPQDF